MPSTVLAHQRSENLRANRESSKLPTILGIGTAVPPHAVSQQASRRAALQHFGGNLAETKRLLQVFDNGGVENRYLCVPLDWFDSPHSFEEKNSIYIEWAERLAAQAASSCLKSCGVDASAINHLIFISNSGMSTPSVDARLINRLGFDLHVRRTPIFGLGCAGGAAGLSHACQVSRADPENWILMVAVELNSLTFQEKDFTKSNLVASSLFSDGAAAALIQCRGIEEGPRVLAAQSTVWPQTLDIMGWDFTHSGLKVVFSPRIPRLVQEEFKSNIEEFLSGLELGLRDIHHFLLHPGGAKILRAYETTLRINGSGLEISREILRAYGNMSSATILFILQRFLQDNPASSGEYGVCAAFGPGFSSELLLLQW